MKTLLTLLFAAPLFVVGCGGGGGGSAPSGPSVAEKPSDIWQGVAYHDDGTEEPVLCYFTPELTVLCATEDGREFDGKITELKEKTFQIEYAWMPEIDAGPDGPVAGEGIMYCEWAPQDYVECDFLGVCKDGSVNSGHVEFAHREDHADEAHSDCCLIHRRLNQAHVAGTWIEEDGPISMLSIDRVGRAYGHNAATGCYFSGTVIQKANPALDPSRHRYTNQYRVSLLIESCDADGYDAYNGKMLEGVAFLDDEQMRNDTLRMMSCADSPAAGPAAFTAEFTRQ
jgi:hypothetical protein